MSVDTQIRSFMTGAPYTIPATMPVNVAKQFMTARHIRHLPVVIDRRLVGLIRDRDLMAELPTSTRLVSDVMLKKPFVVSVAATVREVVHAMALHKHEAAIVTDGDRPIGIFTTMDALRMLDKMLAASGLVAEPTSSPEVPVVDPALP